MANPLLSTLLVDFGSGMSLPVSVLDSGGTGVGPYIPVADNEPARATYGASIFNQALAANPTFFLTLTGQAGKIIRIKSISITGQATAATNLYVTFVRAGNQTGGTSAAVANKGPHDINDTASGLNLQLYSVNPTSRGAYVVLHTSRINLGPASNGSSDRIAFQWGWQNDKAPLLRNATDCFALDLNNQTWPGGGLIDIDLVWTEE